MSQQLLHLQCILQVTSTGETMSQYLSVVHHRILLRHRHPRQKRPPNRLPSLPTHLQTSPTNDDRPATTFLPTWSKRNRNSQNPVLEKSLAFLKLAPVKIPKRRAHVWSMRWRTSTYLLVLRRLWTSQDRGLKSRRFCPERPTRSSCPEVSKSSSSWTTGSLCELLLNVIKRY